MFIIDDIINAIGQNQAANQEAKAVQQAQDQQQQMYNEARGNFQPYLSAGTTSLGSLMSLLSNPNSIQQSPAFQFQMQQGQQALERSAAARGGLNSGGFAKDLTNYSQGLASNEYQNQFNRLYSLAGMGQSSANSLGSLGQGFANSMSNLYGAKGNANAAGQMAIYGGAANSVQDAGKMLLTAFTGGAAAPLMGMGGGGGGGGGTGATMATGYSPSANFGLGSLIPTQGR